MKINRHISLVLGLTLLNFIGISQTLNQLDSEGKRHGKWLVYLDKNWKRTDDSTKAYFKKYTHYDHGVNIYPMGPCGKKGYRLEGPALKKMNGNYEFLDGEYKWFDEKGVVRSIHAFKNGEYIACKEFFKTGELQQHFDYTKKCEGQEHGWIVYVYNKDGSIILTSPTCKDSKGRWPKMRD